MIELGKFTGDIDPDTGYIYVEVADNDVVLARPGMAFPLIGVATKSWLAKYGDKYIAVINYIRDNPALPIVTNILPIRAAGFPTEGYEDNIFLLSEKFRYWLNDSDNETVIEALDTGIIKLGAADATEPGVLGDKLKTILDDLITAITQLTVVSPVGNTSTPVNIASFQQIQQQLDTILSQVVKLK